jgi:hypothetical protein
MKSRSEFFSSYQSRLNSFMKRLTADDKTAQWIADNGMSIKDFAVVDIRVLQAQKAAHNLLTNHSHWLTDRQRKFIEDFKQRASNKKQRQRITSTDIVGILNLGKAANRKDFKQRRKEQARKSR